MSAITIRNIPDEVHNALRKLAKERGQSVESLARELLAEGSSVKRRGGIDFEEVRRVHEAHGVFEDGPPWTEDLDDPALSRRLLGLDE